MNWSVIVAGLLVCAVRPGSSGALKCLQDSKNADCLENTKETNATSELKPGIGSPPHPDCLAGTEWERNCYQCRCTEQGVADCKRNTSCDTNGQDLKPILCKPNTTVQRDCNTCVCLESGQKLCTLNDCKEQAEQGDTDKTNEVIYGKNCAIGTAWKSKCNQCHCDAEGYAVCSEKLCLESEEEPERDCQPHSAWRYDCNSCWCTGDGVTICTRVGCLTASEMNFDDDTPTVRPASTETNAFKIAPSEFDISHNVIRRSTCKPNQSFQNECNICKCSSDGVTYRCTQNECMDREEGVDKGVEVFMENEGVDHIERHSVCQPGGIFYIGCNTCHCNYFGTDYSCTNKPCPLPEDVELFHEFRISTKNKTIVCVANRMFIRDCNTCWCNDDGTGFFCTRKVCVPELPEDFSNEEEKPEELRIIQRECRPDEVFEIDCNMCRCNPDGRSFSCTRRACLADTPMENSQGDNKDVPLKRQERAVQASESPKKCTPSQEFRKDCNKCLCDSSGDNFSCTRIDCLAQNNNNNNGGMRKRREVSDIETTCAPGAVFNKDCNTCMCAVDGKHATCTQNNCSLKTEHKENIEEDSNAEPSFRCTPGEQSKRSCNDCTCSADGKSVFCTLRVCDKDVLPKP